MTRISPAAAELDAEPWCAHCEGDGSEPVRAVRSGAIHHVQCRVCKGEGRVVAAPTRSAKRLAGPLLALSLLLSACVAPSPAPLGTYDGARHSEAEAAAQRDRCAFGPGAYPAETLGETVPIGDAIPLDHILVLMMENRSADHYLGHDPPPGFDGSVDGMVRAALDHPSPLHSWIGTRVAIRNGYRDDARAYLTAEDMPYYHDLYRQWATSDRHFCGLPGPTWPNRYVLLAGQSYGMTENGVADAVRIADGSHLFEMLDRRGASWRVYYSDVPFSIGAFPLYASQHMNQYRPAAELYRDLASGDLPAFALIEPGYIGDRRTDEHAPANPRLGMDFVRSVVEAVQASPAWARLALVITYDEGGGFADHVRPPDGCQAGPWPVPTGQGGTFLERGPRVPLVIVSPWARRGYVSHLVTDATSVLRLIEARWELPALTSRDAAAWPLLDLFDFGE